jgi:glycosyltransferase involved in cell wall biosynthesis
MLVHPSITRDSTAYNWRRKREIYANSRLYVTAISDWLMDEVHASMLMGAMYRVIPNAIDLNVFSPGDRTEARNRLNLPPNAKIILLIAHSMFKDLKTMESALASIRKPDKTGDLIFLCLGKTAEARPLGQGQIRYLGIERDPLRMALYYRASDVYVHGAKAEAFGKAVVEAMSCGIPVVATAVGGIPELIYDGKTGFLVDNSGARHMGELVQRLLDDDGLRFQISKAAISDARQRFELSRQVNAFLGWYADVQEDWQRWKSTEPARAIN